MTAGGRDAAYVSDKIPFSYDYADKDSNATPSNASLDHGTHVAGIAVANAGETAGTAPYAQLAAMKVATDGEGAIPDSAILSALDDSAVLEPDVVNMSLGSNGGFSAAASSTFNDAFETLRAQGTVLSVSEGNSYSSAAQNDYGVGLPAVTNPDSGIASNPSTLLGAFSVASANNSIGRYYVSLTDGTKIPYVQGEMFAGSTGKKFDAVLNGAYACVDCKFALSADIDEVKASHPDGLAGKIAVFRDGTVDAGGNAYKTTARVNAVAALGPAGIVIICQDEGEARPLIVGLDATMPSICISKADGDKLLAASDKTLRVEKDTVLPTAANYEVTDFSSWGPTPDLSLKPEVTAPGGNIYSSVLGGGYGLKSGTSMAAPYIAGLVASLNQYLAAD